jgi:D-ribulokinase
LTPRAASDLGLAAGTAVAAGLIDAHAGGIGTVGARGGPGDVLTRMAYVFGTSACTMTTTARPAFVEGVGSVFLRHGAGAVAERGRSISRRRRD